MRPVNPSGYTSLHTYVYSAWGGTSLRNALTIRVRNEKEGSTPLFQSLTIDSANFERTNGRSMELMRPISFNGWFLRRKRAWHHTDSRDELLH